MIDGSKILIVEDDPASVMALSELLREFGFEVSEAKNGKTALKIVEQDNIELILLDIKLPDIDGFEVCRQLKTNEKYSSIPIIFITAIGDYETRIEAFKNGGTDYITKPYHEEEILVRIKTHLDLYKTKKSLDDLVLQKTSELSKREEQFRAIFNNAPIAIAQLDLQGHPLLTNPAAQKMFGYSGEELANMKFTDFTHPANIESDMELFKELVAGKRDQYSLTKSYIRKDGQVIHGNLRVALIKDRLGNPASVIGMVEDISLLIQANDKLQEALLEAQEANKLKSNFLAHISHELRTPMNGILGYSQLLKEELGDPDLKELVGGINESGMRLSDTISAIIEMANIESNRAKREFSQISISDIANETLNRLRDSAERKSLQIITSIEENIVCLSDKMMLIAIINNLISNAIKYSDEGKIEFILRLEIATSSPNVIIQVKDSGIGIPEDKIELIFDEFRQVEEGWNRNYEGIGLGLTLVKKFVEFLDGDIKAESELGKGSIFTVTLPYSTKQ